MFQSALTLQTTTANDTCPLRPELMRHTVETVLYKQCVAKCKPWYDKCSSYLAHHKEPDLNCSCYTEHFQCESLCTLYS